MDHAETRPRVLFDDVIVDAKRAAALRART